jgi:hypothetical protein
MSIVQKLVVLLFVFCSGTRSKICTAVLESHHTSIENGD